MNIGETGMVTAKAVANYFLTRSFDENNPLDQLKLQKLAYYAYAWYMANYKKPLFPEDIEAWPHGPVIRELWKEFNTFKSVPITCFAKDIDYMNSKTIVPKITDHKFIDFLDAIWKNYKDFTGIQLSNMTHEPEEPWSIVTESDKSYKPRIPDSVILNAFSEKIRYS